MPLRVVADTNITHIQEDEPDNRILECALSAEAEFVVSGDHHLQRLRTFRGIRIVNPRKFLDTKAWM